jgi:diguanylate cyclase (GGDEF)-like protein/PAS domain S-box-containing protein
MLEIDQRTSTELLDAGFAAAVAASTSGVVISNPNLPDNPVVYANAAFEKITGYRKVEIIGRNCRFLQGPHTNPDSVATLSQAVRERRNITLRLLNYRKSGTEFWNELSIGPVALPGGGATAFMGIQRDVSDEVSTQRALSDKILTLEAATKSLEEARAELMRLADHDALTGLATRRFLDERLIHGLARAARTNEPLAVLALGIDAFHTINERYGHATGDEVLRVIASRLRGLVRECDTLARIAGDEFALLMDTGVTTEAMTKIIARIESEMKKPIVVNADTVCLTISIGAAVFPDDGVNAVELVNAADDRMYDIKRLRQGRSFQSNFVPGVAAIGSFAKI